MHYFDQRFARIQMERRLEDAKTSARGRLSLVAARQRVGRWLATYRGRRADQAATNRPQTPRHA